jgi:mRNA-degrading endonuclease RelE of RelBE toxin-antitoxin system
LIEEEIQKRCDFPKSFQKIELSKKTKFEWYRINVNNYSFIYTVDGNTIVVSRFIYNKRDFEKLI